MTKLTTELNELKAMRSRFPVGSDGRMQYTNEFRKRVVELVSNKQMGVTQKHILAELKISNVTFQNWRRYYLKHGYAERVAVAASRRQNSSVISALLAKRADLISEVDKIDQAVELLKELGV